MRLEILRRKSASDDPYWQSFLYEPEAEAETVATALTSLNERTDLRDAAGEPRPFAGSAAVCKRNAAPAPW